MTAGNLSTPAVVVLIAVFSSSCRTEQEGRSASGVQARDAAFFRWDFSQEGEEQVLAFEQQIGFTSGIGEVPSHDESDQTAKATATLAIQSGSDDTADVILKEKKVVGGTPPQEIPFPDSVFSGLREDGTGLATIPSQDAMMRLLFPLPDQALAPGQSATREIAIPTQAYGSTANFPVRAVISLTGYSPAAVGSVANFEVIYSSGEVLFESESLGKTVMNLNGTGSFGFDPDANRYAGGELHLQWETVIEQGPTHADAKAMKSFTLMKTQITLKPKDQ